MKIEPYLFFDGRCEEAIEFYRKTVGAEVIMLMRYKDTPEAGGRANVPVATEDKIMHATLRIGDSQVMASDGNCLGKPNFQGFSLSLTAAEDAEADRLFAALADGGTVHQPLIKTFFASRFGMVADRFGVQWMVLTSQ